MDPVEFLRRYEPFARLEPTRLAAMEKALEIVYAKAGDVLLERGGIRSEHLWIVRKGAVRLEADGRTIDVLGPGECFGFPSLLARSSAHFDVVVDDPGLFYRIDEETFFELMKASAFEAHFRSGLADRLRHALSVEPAPLSGEMSTPLEKLVARAPVFVAPETSVRDAARLMRDERISSVLIDGTTRGILTDRDLRTRVLAEGRGSETPVVEVMSSPLRTISADASVSEALVHLLSERIHHLPVEREGRVVGLVTHTDLLRHHARSPSHLLKKIEGARGPGDLTGYAEEVAAVVEALVWSGLDPLAAGHVVASLTDGAVAAMLRAGERALGPPPCPYAFLVFGSEGRREQALITDQDNALVFAEGGEDNARYFAALAEHAVEGLVAIGVPRCAGEFMATRWNHPLSEWQRLFERWTAEPDPRALLDVANFFDFRVVAGHLDLESLHERIEAGGRSSLFVGQLAKACLGMRPPIGLFHRIKSDDGAVDVKAGGIMPIVGLARVAGLAAGSRERGTLARLRAGHLHGAISGSDVEALEEGFRFLFRIRLREQIHAVRRGVEPTHRILLDELTSLEARHLKETLLHVREMQQGLARRYDVELLG